MESPKAQKKHFHILKHLKVSIDIEYRNPSETGFFFLW